MSIPWYSVNDFLLQCGENRTPLAFSRAVMDQIDALIPFDQGRLYLLDETGKIVDTYCLGVSPRCQEEYRYYADMDNGVCSTAAAAARFARRYPSVEQCLRDGDSYRDASSFYSEYIRPNQIQQSFGLGLRDMHHSLRCMFSFDRICKVPYSDQEIEIMKIIRPHLDNLFQNFYVSAQTERKIPDGHAAPAEKLTRREREIAELLVNGVTPKNISLKLCISFTTVNKHIAHLHEKLNVSTRQELVVKLLRVLTFIE